MPSPRPAGRPGRIARAALRNRSRNASAIRPGPGCAPRPGRPGRRCRTAPRPGWRPVEVGVVQHDQRRLAAQLERDRGDVGRRGGADRPRGAHRPGEADPAHPGVGASGAPASAQPLHDVQHPGGQPSVGRDVGQQRRGQRGPLRRLQHDRVAGRQRRGDPPGGQHERRVPRGDHRGHPGRIPGHLVAVPAGARSRRGRAGAGGRRRTGSWPPPAHHPAPVRAEQRAVVRGLHLGQFVHPGLRRRRRPRAGWRPAPPAASRARPGTRRGSRADGRVRLATPGRWPPGRSRSRRSARCRRTWPGEATRCPPIQCRVSTATPATTAVCSPTCPGCRHLARAGRRARHGLASPLVAPAHPPTISFGS